MTAALSGQARRLKRRRLFVMIGLLMLPVCAWGFLIEPTMLMFEVVPATLPALPNCWNYREIVFFADLQIDMPGANIATINAAVDQIIERNPELVLLGGDFVYRPVSPLAPHIETLHGLLGPLTDAGLPVFAVMGNHDFGVGVPGQSANLEKAQALEEALRDIDIRVLDNEAVPLTPDGGCDPLYLVGIAPAWPDSADAGAALADVPPGAPRIVIMHNPAAFDQIPAGAAPLALAGHTHGGQVGIPGLANAGWADSSAGQPGNHLYITRGIGFAVAPFRLNAPPEVTVITLQQSLAPAKW